jgi:hypothetical protein
MVRDEVGNRKETCKVYVGRVQVSNGAASTEKGSKISFFFDGLMIMARIRIQEDCRDYVRRLKAIFSPGDLWDAFRRYKI